MGGGSWIDYMKRELHKDDVEFDASESIPYLEWSTEYIVYTLWYELGRNQDDAGLYQDV